MFKRSKIKNGHAGLILGLLAVVISFKAQCRAADKGDLSVFYSGLRDENEIALTFDDGPHPLYTPLILSILRDYHARATFFVVGKRVEQFPGLLEKITEQDNELGNHSYSHPNMKKLSAEQIEEELNKTYKLVRACSGERLKYFRPPGGQYDGKVLDCAEKLGYRMVLWDVNPADFKYSTGVILENTRNVRAGDVILLHDGALATIKALPVLLEELKAKGLRCVTISEMLERIKKKKDREKQQAALNQAPKDDLNEGPLP